MAYATGTAANPAALQTVIENFATTNGWTLNAGAGSWLSKSGSQSHVKISSTLQPPVVNIINYDDIRVRIWFDFYHELSIGDTIVVSNSTIPAHNGTWTVYSILNTSQVTITTGSTAADSSTGIVVDRISSSGTRVSIQGANALDGSVELCPSTKLISIPSAAWPVTYELFYSSLPDQVVCVVKYETVRVQYIMFGDIVKIHDNAYIGGNWFEASFAYITGYFPGLSSFTDTSIDVNYGGVGTPCLFASNSASTLNSRDFAQLHHKIDGKVWTTNNSSSNLDVTFTDYTISLLFRSPNTWNNQTNLVPMHLKFKSITSDFMYIGYIEHLRLIRVDNYELGDTITIGSDQWKIYPWIKKDISARNGSGSGYYNTSHHSGTVGFAVRYVP